MNFSPKKSYPFSKAHLVLFGVWFVISLITYLRILIEQQISNTNQEHLSLTWAFSMFTAGSIAILLWLMPFYTFSKRFSLLIRIVILVIHALVYLMLFSILSMLIYNVLFLGNTLQSTFSLLTWYITSEFHNVLKMYFIKLIVLIAMDYFQSREHAIIEKSNLEKELIEVKHNALRAKLQPHFLFNTLNAIVAIIDENRVKAQNALIALSDLLRYSMEIRPHQLITIEEELELLNKYLTIEKSRFEDQIMIEIDNDTDETIFMVPPLILQPIAENAIKHGFKGIDKKLTLAIEVDSSSKRIKIRNNGQALRKNNGLGNGLQIVKQRMKHHFNSDSRFKLHEHDGWIVNELDFS